VFFYRGRGGDGGGVHVAVTGYLFPAELEPLLWLSMFVPALVPCVLASLNLNTPAKRFTTYLIGYAAVHDSFMNS
jgi:hypothetical protein